MPQEFQELIREILERFAATPARVARAVTGKTPVQLNWHSQPDAWSTQEIFAHIRAVDDIFSSRIYMLLAHNDALLVACDERRWADIARYAQIDIQQSLILFALRRTELIDTLRLILPVDWQRTARHEINGTTSLLALVQNIAAHEEEHVSQIEELCVFSA